jgi:regulator of protease activity HflC (stomatin/prohibitin superfamily)
VERRFEERPAWTLAGPVGLVGVVLVSAVGVWLLWSGFAGVATEPVSAGDVVSVVGGFLVLSAGVGLCLGFYVVQPNQADVLILLGRYIGTQGSPGWFWTSPLTVGSRRKVSLRIRNFDTQTVKVNDQRGNPVEIAAVVAWRVVDTARAIFDVDDFEHFVAIQAETAVRHLGTLYPYDSYEEGALSLSGNVDEVSRTLQDELRERLAHAGVEVVETRLSHLSYAPEIAGAMLRRQQATAIVAARQKMVEGAVGMVDMALNMLASEHIVELDEERKAAMVSNLLVVLTGEQGAQPVLNAGSLYQ